MEAGTVYSRRNWLQQAGCGFGSIALADLLARSGFAAGESAAGTPAGGKAANRTANPVSVGPPHFEPKAKRVIFLYMPGGPSHVDLLDPKPRLQVDSGKPLPFEKPKLERTKTGNLLPSPWKFQRHGESGIEVSELLPGLASRIDEVCVIRSMVADNINHTGAALQMCTGEQAFSRPSMGAWLTYGLGTENQNLPGFVVVCPAPVFQGAQLWASSFLPSAYQGTLVRDLKNPISNLAVAGGVDRQRVRLDALRQLNELHRGAREYNSQLDARIASFELAFQMQRSAPEAFDLTTETAATHSLYGTDKPESELFGRQCLLARRLVERGVRFVQVYPSGYGTWDSHQKLKSNHERLCRSVDLPVAGLLHDLKARGLMDETLVVFCTEFGRTPGAQGDGRDHSRRAEHLDPDRPRTVPSGIAKPGKRPRELGESFANGSPTAAPRLERDPFAKPSSRHLPPNSRQDMAGGGQ